MINPDALAPIVLFCYKRPAELRRTVEALQANYLAAQSDLFIFVDGPKRLADEAKINAVRQIVDRISGFKSIHRMYEDANQGLANSVIAGVTKVISQFGSVIVLEDDLVSSPNFLDFMNQALQRYRTSSQLFSITGYTFPFARPSDYPFDGYLYPRTGSWGWATWADRWSSVDWSIPDYESFVTSKTSYSNFAYYGSDRPRMLRQWYRNEIDSWAIRWCYAQTNRGGVTLYPTVSKINNVGFSRDSTNTSGYNRYGTTLDSGIARQFVLPDTLACSDYYIRSMRQKFSLPTRINSRIRSELIRMSRWVLGSP